MLHYLKGLELSAGETAALIDLAIKVKNQPQQFSAALSGMSFALLFEKPSLRTRLSLEVGIHRLGGQPIYIDHKEDRIGARESTADYARNLSLWVHGIVARVYDHATLEALVADSKVPVVNSLCDQLHPCQALADMQTLKEKFGELKGLKLAYVGDGNNVCHSLMLLSAMLGVQLTVLTPNGHGPQQHWIDQAQALAAQTAGGGSVRLVHKLAELGKQDVLYTDTWISMGVNADKNQVYKTFMPYQVNETMVETSGAHYVMHCQPAHRGLEISGALMDSPICLALPQAENRLHAQNALLLKIYNRC